MLSRQAIYQAEKRISLRKKELSKVKPLIQNIRMEMPRLGTRKVYYLIQNELQSMKIKLGRDALFDYLRSEHMLIKPRKSYTKTTFSKHWLRKYPNLYNSMEITTPEQVFVSDITYIKSKERTHYLSLVTDAFSRKIMGYHLSDDMSAETVVQAFNMANKNKQTSYRTIHHSDRGLQYCSGVYQKALKENNFSPSMTDGYDCYQNALAERVNGILKGEFLIYKCKNSLELSVLIKESIDTYNQKRPHLSLNFKTPNFVHEKTVEKNLHGMN